MRDAAGARDAPSMNATATTPTSSRSTAAERFEEIAPVIAARRVAGPSYLLLVGPWLLFVLLLIPPAAVLLTLMAVLALPFVAAALVAAVVAAPYLLVRHVQRVAQRRRSSERSARISSRVAQELRPTPQPGFAVLATETTASKSQ
jgi:hypothetical protein